MLLIYVRHGQPIYDPDSLTPLGERQAEALAKRLALFGVDKIYSSTSERAIRTAKPTCELLNKEVELLDFCNEKYAAADLGVGEGANWNWAFAHRKVKEKLMNPEVTAMGFDWYRHPSLAPYDLGRGIERVYRETDRLLASLGFEHDRFTGRYRVTGEKYKRVALFAHQGFSTLFFSCLMDIPYPLFATRFNISHSAFSVVDFAAGSDISEPQILTLSSDAHLYKEGLPLRYNGDSRLQF